MSSPGPVIVARDLEIAYPGASATALGEVSLEVEAGRTVAVLGPNGSGKSTLLAAIAGVLRPRRGSLEVGGEVVYLPQGIEVDRTFPVSVADVVSMGRWGRGRWFGRLGDEDHRQIAEAIEALGIGAIAERPFGELSGGERQRALLAQAMAQQAPIILLDEPLTGVDRPTGEAIERLIDRWRGEGRSVLVATHDLEAAAGYDLVAALNRRLIAFGKPDVVLTEPILQETFSGHIARIGNDLVDTSHRHPGAA